MLAIGFSIQVPLPFIINDVLKINTRYFGIIQRMFAIGFIPVFPGINFNNEIVLVIYYCFITMILGSSISIIDITATTYLQKTIADNFRSRVMSLQFSLVKIILPLALILSGFAIDFMPIHVVLIFGSFLIFLSVIVWYRKYLSYTKQSQKTL
ncbi:hypothetical protein Y919_09730 [Caloranaerobacter azorensis H53214]|uniref:Uncharacterized protein n=1 Tax=Caloranaerobacter azorensis H53214 TaxID=1156417 RepID=A0A096CTD2_9FIRM|nr:hypothetical protein [Caloranaerobacter azorensis]KGG79819.1 hypothetical protein Y919_09730 [Caloranaerobacter azorensis H53214]